MLTVFAKALNHLVAKQKASANLGETTITTNAVARLESEKKRLCRESSFRERVAAERQGAKGREGKGREGKRRQEGSRERSRGRERERGRESVRVISSDTAFLLYP